MLSNSKLISARSKTFCPLPFATPPFPKDKMKAPIPKNRMEINHFPKDFDLDLALVIFFTLLCIPFILIPPLNETPIRIILGLPLVLFLPGYSLIATLFPGKDDLDAIERIALSFGLSIAITPLLGLALNYTPFGIRLSPILIVLSVFTISLAMGAYVRRCRIPEEDRFVAGFKDFLLAQVFFFKKKKCVDVRRMFNGEEAKRKGFLYKTL